MFHGILPKLTRGYILDRISQEQIFSYYMGIPEGVIFDCLSRNKLICSPLRVDHKADCGFFVKADRRITFNDFAGYFTGDCFDVVGYQHLINADDPVGFNRILEIVAKDFRIHRWAGTNSNDLFAPKTYAGQKAFTTIEITKRDWNYADKNYWLRFNINTNILNSYQVFPVRFASINSNNIYYYKDSDPCYAYYLGTDSVGVHWKLYFPYRKEYKFITNSNKAQGTQLIRESAVGIITKSLKDVMSLASFGINAVSVPSESTELSNVQYAYLKKVWSRQYTLFDFDYAGITLANRVKKQNIPALFLTNGKFQSYDFEAKDFSEHVDKWGIRSTQNLIDFIKDEGFAGLYTSNFEDFKTYNYG